MIRRQVAAMMPTVHVIVLNYNGRAHNGPCLRSILAQEYPALRILFVDNGSDDGSVEAVRQEFRDDVDCLLNHQNLYFAAGNNRGIQLALDRGAKYVFVVNNDTVMESGCIAELVEFMESHPEAGGCQPLLTTLGNGPKTVYSAGVQVSLSGRCWDDGRGRPLQAHGTAPSAVAGITGAAMFLSAKAVRDVGLLDERYVMYFEDVDYSFRLLRAGYGLYCVPGAHMGHVGSATASATMPDERVRLCEINSYRLILSHFPEGLRNRALAASLIFSLGSGLLNLLRGRVSTARAVLSGGWQGVRLIARSPEPDDSASRESVLPRIRTDVWYPPGA